MVVWLFEDLGINDPVQDFKRFHVLLRATIGNIAGDMYYPHLIFQKEKENHAHAYAESYSKRFEELRTQLFAQRDVIMSCATPSELGAAAPNVHNACEAIYHDLIFVLATMPEQYRWIGSCDIHKQVGGVFKGMMNEFSALLHILHHLQKKCTHS